MYFAEEEVERCEGCIIYLVVNRRLMDNNWKQSGNSEPYAIRAVDGGWLELKHRIVLGLYMI